MRPLCTPILLPEWTLTMHRVGDITGWLLNQYKDWKKPAEDTMLQGDARLIIVAGSDTTAAASKLLCAISAVDKDAELSQ